MLTKAGMLLVFVLEEKITLGREFSNGDEISYGFYYGKSSCKVPQKRVSFRKKRVKRW